MTTPTEAVTEFADTAVEAASGERRAERLGIDTYQFILT